MIDFLAAIITILFVTVCWYPKEFGEKTRKIYDQFSVGWNHSENFNEQNP